MRKSVVAVLVGLVVALVAVSWQVAAASSPDRPALDRSVAGHERAGGLERAEGKLGKGRKDRAGGTVVVGTVKAVRDGALDVAKDGGGEATVTTGPSTKTRGVDLAGLRPGQRVVVRAKDGKALMVSVPQAHARGTVTALDGDRATLVEFEGSTRTLELSGVADKPKVGDLVAVRGTASGDVLVVERVRRLSR